MGNYDEFERMETEMSMRMCKTCRNSKTPSFDPPCIYCNGKSEYEWRYARLAYAVGIIVLVTIIVILSMLAKMGV